jgi:hypothetical protein
MSDVLKALGRMAAEDEKTAEAPAPAPFTAAETDAVADAVFAQLGLSAPVKAPAPAPAPAPVEQTAQVLSFRTRRLTNAARLLVPVALAAGLAIFLLPSSGPRLPGYGLEVVGQGAQVARGPASAAAGAPIRYVAGNTVELLLRPESRTDAPPEVAAYVSREGTLAVWKPDLERDPGGAVRVTGKVGTAPLAAAGPVTLLMAVTPRALPADAPFLNIDALEAAVTTAGGRLLTFTAEIAAETPGVNP